MTITWTDIFAGAGGSSQGAASVPGVVIRIAANHSQLAVDLCLAWALERDERFGVLGGLSERERRELKKRTAA